MLLVPRLCYYYNLYFFKMKMKFSYKQSNLHVSHLCEIPRICERPRPRRAPAQAPAPEEGQPPFVNARYSFAFSSASSVKAFGQ